MSAGEEGVKGEYIPMVVFVINRRNVYNLILTIVVYQRVI